MKRAEEQRLLRRAAAGDRDACEQCIRAHQDSVYAYLLRLSGRPDVAEDIAQEAFVRVLLNLDRYDPRYRFSTWLFTIARRLYINACQKLKPVYDTDAASSSWTGARPDLAMDRSEWDTGARDALQRSLMQLSPEQREIIVLFHQHDWSIAQVAEHMGMPEGTVKSHLHRGRRRLRVALAELEDSLSNRPEGVTL